MKTVIEMARESKVVPVLLVPHGEYFKFLEHFAELVRADAIAEEREACAKVCEAEGSNPYATKHAAAAIRARGQK